ncbi:MAG: response regulator transcription factor [Holophaga sp.]|nr:response regulator transcription factor [Holophaga sp.]
MLPSLRVAVAEDEPMNLNRMVRLLKGAGCEVVGTFSNGRALMAWLQSRPDVDALFLDIRMPGPSGLEVLRSMPDAIPVVFVSGFPEHAVDAFEDEAVDYVLKPATAERLDKCLARIRKRLAGLEPPPPAAAPPPAAFARTRRYPVKAGEGVVFLDLAKTTHFEVVDEVVFAHAGGRFQTQWKALSEVEAAFPDSGLLRIHRHLLICPEHVVGVKPAWGGRLVVNLGKGIELETSRGATAKLKARLGLP